MYKASLIGIGIGVCQSVSVMQCQPGCSSWVRVTRVRKHCGLLASVCGKASQYDARLIRSLRRSKMSQRCRQSRAGNKVQKPSSLRLKMWRLTTSHPRTILCLASGSVGEAKRRCIDEEKRRPNGGGRPRNRMRWMSEGHHGRGWWWVVEE